MKQKKYNDWVNEYSGRVVIKKEGYFYTTRENSAYIIALILGYNIGISEPDGVAITGSPSLEKMTDELKKHHISYIAIVSDEIIDEKEFADNQFWEFVDEEFAKKAYQMALSRTPQRGKEVKTDEEIVGDNNKLLGFIDILLNGIDPWSGELFEKDHFMNCREMKEILLVAQIAMQKQNQKIKNKPVNSKVTWTNEEENLLVERFKEGISAKELAKLHGRSIGAVKARLLKLGLIE